LFTDPYLANNRNVVKRELPTLRSETGLVSTNRIWLAAQVYRGEVDLGEALSNIVERGWGSFQYQGRLHRTSLGKWANRDVRSKADAETILDDMRRAVRACKFERRGDADNDGPLTFSRFATLYVDRYVNARRRRRRPSSNAHHRSAGYRHATR
jgi:hypothetical protein